MLQLELCHCLTKNAREECKLQIKLLKDAGAIIMAKTNMAEWAFAPDISIGSAFGVVRNPYDLDRSTGGSSGGTAAGIHFWQNAKRMENLNLVVPNMISNWLRSLCIKPMYLTVQDSKILTVPHNKL